MSVLLDSFIRYANSIAMPDWDPTDVKAGIESYLHDHSLLESDDGISAEVELLIFKEMPPSTFNAFFAKYAKRKAVETIEATARQAALQRALLGEVVSETDYHALCNQLIEASTVLSQDNQNRQWLKGRLNDTLIDLKYSAGLSNELSESIARKLCERSKKLDENHINMNSAF